MDRPTESERPRDRANQTATDSADPQAAGPAAAGPAAPPRWPRRVVGGLLLAALGVAVFQSQSGDEREPPRRNASVLSNGSADERADSDRRLRKLLCGTWQRENNGENVLTLDEDGTGTLVYKPAGKNYVALGFVSRLEIDIEWTVEDGYVDFHSVRGTPQHAFELASLAEGKRKYRRIAELDETHLILVNETQKDDGPKSEWFRVE